MLSRAEVEAEYQWPTKRFLELAATRGDGPPFVKGGHRTVRYRRADLEAWLASRTVASTAERR